MARVGLVRFVGGWWLLGEGFGGGCGGEGEFEDFEAVRWVGGGGCEAEVVVGGESNFVGGEAGLVVDGNREAGPGGFDCEAGRWPSVAVCVVAVPECQTVDIAMCSVFGFAIVEEATDLLDAAYGVYH